MRKDETGKECPETLGEYRKMVVSLIGDHNAATKFLDDKIKDSPNGKNEIVVVPDSQMRMMLFPLMLGI